MDIEYLKRFVTVGQTLNFRKASELLFISQPALTHSINTLEKELEVQLLDRNTKNVKLTDTGKIFLDSCLRIISIYDSALASIKFESDKGAKALNIGYTGPALGRSMSPWITQFKNDYPDINIQVIRYRGVEIHEALASRAIQLAILFEGNVNLGQLEYEIVAIEKFRLMVNSNDPLAAFDKVPLERIENEPFLICNKESSPTYYNKVMGFFAKKHMAPSIAYEVKDISELYRLVEMGMGVAIVSVSDTSFYDNFDLKFIEIEDIDPQSLLNRRLLGWIGDLTPAAKKFKRIVDSNPIRTS